MRYLLTPTPVLEMAAARPAAAAPARPYTRTPQEKLAQLEAELRAEGDVEGLRIVQAHRDRLLQDLSAGFTRCLLVYDRGEPSTIASAADVRADMASVVGSEQEECWALYLDNRHRIIGRHMAARGTLDSVRVSVGDVYRYGLRLGAAAVIVVHNHPAGDPKPSPQDEMLTIKMQAAGSMLGVRLLDHVVVAREGYYSFAEAKRIPE